MTDRAIDLVAFDIDGTLIQHPNGQVVWRVLNARFGAAAVEEQRFKDHLEGRISYEEWVRLDIEGWRDHGADRDSIVAELEAFELLEGARATLETLGDRGYQLAAVSGTLDILVETVFPDHPFAHLFCNQISFDDEGAISGWRATPYDFHGKAEALRDLSDLTGVPVSRMAFLGDDINDVAAAKAAGLSVAVRPRAPELEAACDIVLKEGSLEQLLKHFP